MGRSLSWFVSAGGGLESIRNYSNRHCDFCIIGQNAPPPLKGAQGSVCGMNCC